jgi:hypothetical protein
VAHSRPGWARYGRVARPSSPLWAAMPSGPSSLVRVPRPSFTWAGMFTRSQTRHRCHRYSQPRSLGRSEIGLSSVTTKGQKVSLSGLLKASQAVWQVKRILFKFFACSDALNMLLPRACPERSRRFNATERREAGAPGYKNRKITDGERFSMAVSGVVGNLTFKSTDRKIESRSVRILICPNAMAD